MSLVVTGLLVITYIALSARTNPYLFSFFPRTITDWNQLSREQRLKPSINSFRQSLHTDSSIDILSRDTPAVTGRCPLPLDIYRKNRCWHSDLTDDDGDNDDDRGLCV